MAKKQYYAIIDTETTIADTVADCAIIICDRNGVIYNQMAVIIKDEFENNELFHEQLSTNIVIIFLLSY